MAATCWHRHLLNSLKDVPATKVAFKALSMDLLNEVLTYLSLKDSRRYLI